IRSTAGITCSKVLSGCPAEEPEHSSLTQSMRFDRQVDEQSLKSWVCRFNSSGSGVSGTHASGDECSNKHSSRILLHSPLRTRIMGGSTSDGAQDGESITPI